ncbi:MAG TPA: hypothetical protein VFY29_04365 [Terriglobia bacterium]|nr:hypothetical protein [Terriglobia bacterium]
MKPETIRVGDFVICRSRYHRDQLLLPDEPGLVIEIKRNNFKVLYGNDKRGWIGRELLGRVKAGNLTGHPVLDTLQYLLHRVRAHECEFIPGPETQQLAARIDQIDTAAIDDIRAFLGAGFVSLEVVPEGMVFMQVEIAWRTAL